MPEAILMRVEDGIAVLTLNRPEVRNAIDDAMRAVLRETICPATQEGRASITAFLAKSAEKPA